MELIFDAHLLPEGEDSALLLEWKKNPGDRVTKGDVLCELEAGKATIDFTAPSDGIMGEWLAEPGAPVEAGTPMTRLQAGNGAADGATTARTPLPDQAAIDFTHDLIVIGAGPGGYVAALRARAHGMSCLVIEKDQPGGTCANWGCIPSKSLLHHASLAREIRPLQELGATVSLGGLSYAAIHRKSRQAADGSARAVKGLLKKHGAELCTGIARLGPDRQVIASTPEGTRTFRGRAIILATGSLPRGLPGAPFDGKRILSSTHLLAMDTLPSRLLVVGAGVIGLELAWSLASFGSTACVLEARDRILPLEDADTARILRKEMEKDGLTFRTGIRITAVRTMDDGVEADIVLPDGSTVTESGSHLLVAIGRQACTEGLGLPEAGVELDDRGFVKTGTGYATTASGIHAIGDLAGRVLLAHSSSREGEIAVDFLKGLHDGTPLDPDTVPRAVYVEPSTGSFGPTEDELKSAGRDYRVSVLPYSAIGKAQAIGKTPGQIKILTDPSGTRILGGHLVGYQASELVHEVLLAALNGISPEAVAEMVHAHPGLSEGIRDAMAMFAPPAESKE